MKRIFFLLLCFGVHSSHAQCIFLDSLKFDTYHTYKQKIVMHESKISKDVLICEFVEKDTLYIISNAFVQDYNEYTYEIPDVPSLVREIISICPTECRDGNCGYTFTYDSGLPSTLTIHTFPNMDTIQYMTTDSPSLFSAVIQDTIFGSSNIRCGISIQELLFNRLSIDTMYHDYTAYDYIVLIPEEFTYSTYQKKGYVALSELCFQLRIKDEVLNQIMIKHSIYSGKIVNKFSQIYELKFY